MKILEITRYFLNLLFISTLVIALISQLLIWIDLLPARYLKEDLIARHRSSGQLALVAFVLIALVNFGRFDSLPLIQKGGYLVHIPLLTICGISRLGLIWRIQKSNGISKRNLLIWWLTIFLVGLIFLFFCCGMLLWQLSLAQMEILVWGEKEFNLFSIGHIGLAIVLILLGRSGLRTGHLVDNIIQDFNSNIFKLGKTIRLNITASTSKRRKT